LSRNRIPVNVVYHSRNADTAAFWEISSYYKKLPYTRNLANWFSGKSLKLLPPDVTFKAKNAPNLISAGALPQTLLGSLQRSPKPASWI